MACCREDCLNDIPDVLLETMTSDVRTREDEKKLESHLRRLKFKVDFGAGKTDELTFDQANERYLSNYFPDLDKNAYCYPLVYEYKHPKDPLELDERGVGHAIPASKVNVDTLLRERRGELAEEEAVEKFSAMFRKYNTPSFIIHGYKWSQQYSNELKKKTKSLVKKVFSEEGEMDLLISLPSTGLIALEVKAVNDVSHIRDVVKKGFAQCSKAAQFVSKASCLSDPVCIIKAVVLPNCTDKMVGEHFCEICRAHIVTSNDLASLTDLHRWFQKIKTQYANQIGRSPLQPQMHCKIIGRLIAPAALNKVASSPHSIQRMVDLITMEHGTLDCIKERAQWQQLTPMQLSVKWKDPQFLFLFGPPGSGKTILALGKAEEILESGVSYLTNRTDHNHYGESHSTDTDDIQIITKSVLYIQITEEATLLKEFYETRLKKLQQEDCDLVIESGHCYSVDDFVSFVEMLKKRFAGKLLHIVCEESVGTILGPFDQSSPLIETGGLGYVWVIMPPRFSFFSNIHFEPLPPFKVIHLENVMRMSRQNIEFTNMLFSAIHGIYGRNPPYSIKPLKAGHAINGPRPLIYRMKCACLPQGDFSCVICSPFRKRLLLNQAQEDLQLGGLTSQSYEDFVLLFDDALYRCGEKLYPSRGREIGFLEFMGCEHNIVMVSSDHFFDIDSLFFQLTRSLGKLIILDTGCWPGYVDKYSRIMDAITRAAEVGKVNITEINPKVSECAKRYMRIAFIGSVLNTHVHVRKMMSERENKKKKSHNM